MKPVTIINRDLKAKSTPYSSLRQNGVGIHVAQRISSRNSRVRFQAAPKSQLQFSTSQSQHNPRTQDLQTLQLSSLEAPAAARHTSSSPSTIPELWDQLASKHGNFAAFDDPHAPTPSTYTFQQLADTIKILSAALRSLGLKPKDTVSLISENSSRWMIADQAVQSNGAADAVRGISSTVEELAYIIENSESSGLIVQDSATLEKLLPVLKQAPLNSSIRWVLILWGGEEEEPAAQEAKNALSIPVLTFDQALEKGQSALQQEQQNGNGAADKKFQPDIDGSSLATIIYTSGTTGHPKGVKLTHSNLLYQVNNFKAFLEVVPGDKTLALLPPWHVYERACELFILSSGATQIYTKILKFKDDLSKHKPDHFVCVPLVLDTLHSKVMLTLKKASVVRRTLALSLLSAATACVRARRVLDGVAIQYAVKPPTWMQLAMAWIVATALTPLRWLCNLLVAKKVRQAVGIQKTVVSGGGSLPTHLDDFFEVIGISVLNGWGLTETSPVLACRSVQLAHGNPRGTVGRPIPGTFLRIVDPENKSVDVPDGTQGLILAKGPGVMTGYARNSSATAAVFVGDGWFDTGDLGWRAPAGVKHSNMEGCIVLTGRAKDTIVLTNGENVEPQPIEDELCTSQFVKFAMLIGQGHRAIGALIVPDTDALADYAAKKGVDALSDGEMESLIKAEVAAATKHRVRWEQVHAIKIVKAPFSVEDGTLTRTMKIRRQVIVEKYKEEVQQLEKSLR